MKEIYNCQPEHYLKTLAIKLGLNAVVIKHKNRADFPVALVRHILLILTS